MAALPRDDVEATLKSVSNNADGVNEQCGNGGRASVQTASSKHGNAKMALDVLKVPVKHVT